MNRRDSPARGGPTEHMPKTNAVAPEAHKRNIAVVRQRNAAPKAGRWQTWIAWAVTALTGAAIAAWIFPHAIVFAPEGWSLTREQARDRALENLATLGELPDDPYVVVELDDNPTLEWRLLGFVDEVGVERLLLAGLWRHRGDRGRAGRWRPGQRGRPPSSGGQIARSAGELEVS